MCDPVKVNSVEDALEAVSMARGCLVNALMDFPTFQEGEKRMLDDVTSEEDIPKEGIHLTQSECYNIVGMIKHSLDHFREGEFYLRSEYRKVIDPYYKPPTQPVTGGD